MASFFASVFRRVLSSLFAGALLGVFVSEGASLFFPEFERYVEIRPRSTWAEHEEAQDVFKQRVYTGTWVVVSSIGVIFGSIRFEYGPTAESMTAGALTGVVLALVTSRIVAWHLVSPDMPSRVPAEPLYWGHLIGVPLAAILGALIGFVTAKFRIMKGYLTKQGGTK